MRSAAVIFVAILLVGCAKPPPPSSDPVAAFKLECRNQDSLLVFILDPKNQVVTMGNITEQPKGTFTTSSYEYYMRFPRGGRMHANDARVNRYDGEMEREFGEPPFLTGGVLTKNENTFQIWQCKRFEAKPIL